MSEHDRPGSTAAANESAMQDAASQAGAVVAGGPPRRDVPPRRRRAKLLTASLLVALLMTTVIGLLLWRTWGTYESTDDAQVDVHLYPVSARVSGYVLRVKVGDNEYVKAGTTLVEIDPKDYQVAVDRARAELGTAEATANSLDIAVPITTVSTSSQLTSSASDVDNAAAGIISAEKQLAATRAQVLEA